MSQMKNDPKVARKEDPMSDEVWSPNLTTSLKLLFSARLASALWCHITDCDETYNYWEPLHYLLYGKGFQTWEYSPEFSIRSYAYIWLHSLPLQLYSNFIGANKILSFYMLRCLLAFICSLTEVYFYKGVLRQYGGHVSRLLLAFLLFSPGMYISSIALLPSSFAMYMTMLAFGAWLQDHLQVAIMAVAASTFLGWPFAALIGVPIAVDIVWRRRKYMFFINWSFRAVAFILGPQVIIDTRYFGKPTFAAANIVLYNVFSEHGPDLYGVEPWTFYFMNGFLNFNIAFILSFAAVPLLLLTSSMIKAPRDHKGIPSLVCLSSLYLWILVFFTRPHKEERFLFPVYPLFALAAAFSVDAIQRIFHWLLRLPRSYHHSDVAPLIPSTSVVLFALLSISRIVALYFSYHAPMDVYLQITKLRDDRTLHRLPASTQVNVCVGKEWYRFSSSFFLPANNWNLAFIKSDFRGQLPKPYASGPDATRIIPKDMNDKNLEEPSRYVDVQKCHYLIDVETGRSTPNEPRYSVDEQSWKVVYTTPFLDAYGSHRLLRAFYIPFLTPRNCRYHDYNILQTKRTRQKKPRSKSES